MILESFGASVVPLNRPRKARRLLETMRPHVLVTDIAMPDDGLEVIRNVKARRRAFTSRPSRLQPTRPAAKSFWPRASRNCSRNTGRSGVARRPLRAQGQPGEPNGARPGGLTRTVLVVDDEAHPEGHWVTGS